MNFVFILQSVEATVLFAPCFNIKIFLILSTKCIYGSGPIIRMNNDYVSLNGNNQLIFIMKMHCLCFELVTAFLNSVQINLIFQGLIRIGPFYLKLKSKLIMLI
jgi:hypothetical protein